MSEITLECQVCHKSFSKTLKYYNYFIKRGRKHFYCSPKCFQKTVQSSPLPKICLFCQNEFISSTKRQSKKCCSDECAHKYAQSFVDPNFLSKISKRNWEKRKLHFVYKPKAHEKKCIVCQKLFMARRGVTCCSKECKHARLSNCGRISVNLQKQRRRSKNEVEFAELCRKEYANILENEPIFNGWDADVILPEQKIAVLWNGNWHFKKLTQLHSVQQVVTREKIKLDEIRKMGYTPYIIEDRGKHNLTFVKEEFEKFKLFINNGCIV